MTALADRWHATWHVPVAAARPWLLARLLPAVLAFDAWTLMVVKAGRYGTSTFNVAHFGWLDVLLPAPTASSQLTVVLLIGALAALAALGSLGRAGLALLTGLYTYAWMASQLDSYQHHYFLSWALLCLTCLPRLDAAATRGPRRSAPAARLLAALCAIVYAFTALSKTEPQWLHGEVLQRIHRDGAPLQPLLDLAAALGLSPETAWLLGGLGVVAVQVVIAAGYSAAALTSESSRVGRPLRWAALPLALLFHAAADHLGLKIGWFGGYMMLIAIVMLAPEPWVRAVAAVPAALAARARRLDHIPVRPPIAWSAAIGACAAAAAVASQHDLPGALAAGVIASGGALILIGLAAREGGPPVAVRHALAVAAVAFALHATFEVTPTRYDYWRFVGGDALRRGDLDAAVLAYARANTHAPPGGGRWNEVEQVRSLRARPARR